MSPKSASGKSRTGALYLASIGNLRQPAIKRAGSEAIPDGMQTVATREAPPRDVTPNKRNNHVAQVNILSLFVSTVTFQLLFVIVWVIFSLGKLLVFMMTG